MGLGCSGKILPSPSSSSPTRIWKMDSSRVSLRNRRFRSARIDPSRLPSTDGFRDTESCRRKKSNLKEQSKKKKKKKKKKRKKTKKKKKKKKKKNEKKRKNEK